MSTTARGMRQSRVTGGGSAVTWSALGAPLDLLLLAIVLIVPFTKFFLGSPEGVKLTLSNVIAVAYVIAFVAVRVRARDASTTRAVWVLAGFFVAFTAVDAAGYVGIDSLVGRTQFAKAMAIWLVHGSFMVCAAAHVARVGMPLAIRCVRWFVVGSALSASWGIAQLLGVSAGVDIDRTFLGPLPFAADGTGNLQYYGGGLYRVTGLTLDSNHLGVLLASSLLLALTWLRGRWRWPVGALLAAGMAATLSRSAALAVVAGAAVLAWRVRHRLVQPRALLAIGSVALVTAFGLLLFVQANPEMARSLLFGRLDVSTSGAQTHLRLYELVPELLGRAPLVGNGLNSFALLFGDINGGREGFGPHSHYIRLLVENGLIGFALFAAFAGILIARLWRMPGLPAAGLLAAIVAMLAGNIFYLTTQVMYVELLYALAAALPAAAGLGYAGAMQAPSTSTPSGNFRREAHDAQRTEPTQSHDERAVLEAGTLARALGYWWVVLLLAIVGAALGVLATGGRTASHQASATVYLGQPVGISGQLLPTIGSKAATGIDLATSSAAVRAGADAAGVAPARVRLGLVVAAVQSPLASKLQAPPAILRITVRDRTANVAEKAAGAVAEYLVFVTGGFARQKQANLEREITFRELQVNDLTRQRKLALAQAGRASGDSVAMITILVATINNGLNAAQADLVESRSELQLVRELETSRVIDEPAASRVATTDRSSSIVMAGFVGLVAGLGMALLLGSRRSRRNA